MAQRTIQAAHVDAPTDGLDREARGEGVRRLSFGAEAQPGGGTAFRVWAPKRRSVEVLVQDGPVWKAEEEPVVLDLKDEGGGWFSGLAGGVGPGSLYRYRLDGGDSFPDPASRFQPEGPHGPSQVVDPSSFRWTDDGWRGLKLPGQVLYEMHVGTLTPEGTWEAAAKELPALKELGITCVEVMPVAEFPGAFGWGYDGVDLFAPYHVYGGPDDFRRFVDEAHRVGLVLRHYGIDG